jgi:ureidoglycolate lyase
LTLSLHLQPITAEAFAPFGQILPALQPGHAPFDLVDELQNARASAGPRLSLTAVPPTALPFRAERMERHIHSSQAFLPIECSAYLVLVAPQRPDGLPDLSGLKGFRVPGDVGINYKADTWHHPIAALDRMARFAVLTFVDGTDGDQQFIELPRPALIEA